MTVPGETSVQRIEVDGQTREFRVFRPERLGKAVPLVIVIHGWGFTAEQIEGDYGWNDLAVGVSGGGATPHIALLRFSGGRYPSNPSTQPILNRLPEGARELIADDAAALTPAR